MTQRWQLRPATAQDADRIVELVQAEDRAVRGRSDFSREMLEQLVYADSSFDFDHDQVVVELDGELIGLGMVVLRLAYLTVDPDHEESGLRAELLGWVQTRQGELGRTLRVGTSANHAAQVALFTEAGYEFERFYALMVRTFAETGPPEPPQLAPGYRVRLVDRDADAEILHALNERAFGARPDHEPQSLEDFTRGHLLYAEYEPAWSLIAETDDSDAVGLCIGWRPPDHPHGYVALLGVDPGHRRRGLAPALLLTAFTAIHAAGLPTAELHVASDNPKALTVYTGVGMVEDERFDHYVRPS